MRIVLPADLQSVIDEVAERLDLQFDQALEFVVRDWAIGNGFIAPDSELGKDTPVDGSA